MEITKTRAVPFLKRGRNKQFQFLYLFFFLFFIYLIFPFFSSSSSAQVLKPNISHTEAASGVMALIKVCLMLYNREWLPSVLIGKPHFEDIFKTFNMTLQVRMHFLSADEEFLSPSPSPQCGSFRHLITTQP